MSDKRAANPAAVSSAAPAPLPNLAAEEQAPVTQQVAEEEAPESAKARREAMAAVELILVVHHKVMAVAEANLPTIAGKPILGTVIVKTATHAWTPTDLQEEPEPTELPAPTARLVPAVENATESIGDPPGEEMQPKALTARAAVAVAAVAADATTATAQALPEAAAAAVDAAAREEPVARVAVVPSACS